MIVTTLGHAGMLLQSETTKVAVDPWMNPEGAFQASWFQFPENSHLLQSDALNGLDAVVISHEHMDHVDPWTLARLPMGTPIVIPRYSADVLKQKIALSGQTNVTEVDQWDKYEISADLSVFFVSEPPMNHDSAMVFETADSCMLNLNDARLFPMQVRELITRIDRRIDVLTFQGAGASWFPICYDYSEQASAKLSLSKRRAKLAYCYRMMKLVDPVIGMPFAGPPAFLDDELRHVNSHLGVKGIFPDQEQVVNWLRSAKIDNTVLMLPGDTWDTTHTQHVADPTWESFSFADTHSYIADYAKRRMAEVAAVRERHAHPDADLWPAFRDYFQRMIGISEYFNRKIDMRVGFTITGPHGGAWAVDFREGREEVSDEQGECQYNYTFESRWLPPILNGEVPFEDFLLSLRFSATRNPDRYNDHLLGLLKFASEEPLERIEEYEATMIGDETFELSLGDELYRVQRHCPHQGSDLLDQGEVVAEEGVLRCLAHHYEFDVRTGECLTGTSDPLRVERIQRVGELVAE